MNVKRLKEVFHNKIVISLIYSFVSIITIVPIAIWYISILENCFSKEYQIIKIYNIFDCFKQMKIEKEGIRFTKDGTHGTASLVTPQEIDILKIGEEENTPGIVLGKTLDTDEIITLPDNCKEINRNIMIWGSSGSR